MKRKGGTPVERYRENWFYFGGAYFVILAFAMGFWGSHFSHIQVILTYSFMALLIHQFEEYALPGGFPAVWNMAVNKEKERPERFPLNKNSSFIVNVILAYPFYLVPIFLPKVIWLGLAQVLFGMLQLIVHGLFINVKIKGLYNPGLGAVVFLHIPIGIYYIWYVSANGLAGPWDYVGGVICLLAAAICIVGLPVRLLADRESRYPFSKDEMERFRVLEKLRRRGLCG
ncbi:MAG: HXXEE domain-containing protein [Bacillota bacterium]|nr:HXXEE domain-containing protein [Bacillota bacterium]